MLTGRQTFSLLFSLVGISLVLLVGRLLARRRIEGPARRASRMFVLFWFALAADALVNDLTMLGGAWGFATRSAMPALVVAAMICIVLFLWGLVYYLLYLFSGSERIFWPLTVFYVLSFIGGLAFIFGLGPNGVGLSRWGFTITYDRDPSGLPALLFAAFFLLPPILGSLAYGIFGFRLKGATQRYRVALVSIGIFVWFAGSLVLGGAGLADNDVAQIVARLLPIAAISVILAAYLPPRWVQERFGVTPLEDEVVHSAARGSRLSREEKRAMLAERARELV